MTKFPFADRPPTATEVERIRLLLSTYQDGSGMLRNGELPGWRDFERAVAAALGGEAPENKSVFDVVMSDAVAQGQPKVGISCKMRSELNRVGRDGRVTIEVSNANGEFWDALAAAGVTKESLSLNADRAGGALSSVVRGWHQAVSHATGGTIDLSRSCYLVLLWNDKGEYQLFQFRLEIWDPAGLRWSVPLGARRLCGHDGNGNLIEWYYASGGQLKLYPPASAAVWQSEKFRLEPLPERVAPLVGKAAAYFPEKWAASAEHSSAS
jgi:hypothetical protein